MRAGNVRAGKVSIEALHKCTCANTEMRTRPRPSGFATRWGHEVVPARKPKANAPTTERLCREGPQRPGDVGLDGPKRSVDVGKRVARAYTNLFYLVLYTLLCSCRFVLDVI